MTAVCFDNVTFRHQYDDFDVLCGATFALDEQTCTVLIDSQCGKTTLCRLLMGELKAQNGQILLDGAPVDNVKPGNVGMLYLSCRGLFFDGKSVAQNIAYPLVVRKVERKTRDKIVASVAERLAIADLLAKRVRDLTDDQRRLVVLARGLTVPRRIVLFDDFFVAERHAETPFDSYDIQTVFALFADSTKIVVTSNPNLAIGKTAVIDGGKCVLCGTPEQAVALVDDLGWK